MTAAKLHTIDFSHGPLLTPGKRFQRSSTPEKSPTSALWITHGKKKKKVAQNVENRNLVFGPLWLFTTVNNFSTGFQKSS